MEVTGSHALSRWADTLGPPLQPLDVYTRTQLARDDARAWTRGVRERSVDVDMKCLRGIMPATLLPRDDLGVYASQSSQEAELLRREAQHAMVPPRLLLDSELKTTSAATAPSSTSGDGMGAVPGTLRWPVVSSTWETVCAPGKTTTTTTTTSTALPASRVLQRSSLSLMETACLIACPALIKQQGITPILERIIHEGFDIVQLKVGCMTTSQARR